MDENGDPDEDVCGICRVPFEGCCPTCKVPGDDCPLSRFLSAKLCAELTDNAPILRVWGECSHVFHMHCLLKWIGTAASKQQCPMDRRLWGAICRLPLFMALGLMTHIIIQSLLRGRLQQVIPDNQLPPPRAPTVLVQPPRTPRNSLRYVSTLINTPICLRILR
jgi:anaphase-promoting complex subunit 11